MAKAKKTTSTVDQTTQQDTPTASVEPVQLTIADLQMLAKVVDLASRRGAFQAGELSQVGEVYNKLAGFLAYVESQQKESEGTTATQETAGA